MCPHDNCQGKVRKRHCKLVCSKHGVIADCSDPFRF